MGIFSSLLREGCDIMRVSRKAVDTGLAVRSAGALAYPGMGWNVLAGMSVVRVEQSLAAAGLSWGRREVQARRTGLGAGCMYCMYFAVEVDGTAGQCGSTG